MRLSQQSFTTKQAFAWYSIMPTVLYCENAPYAQNQSIGFEQTLEIELTNNILFSPIDLLYLQFIADLSLGDCEKSTHCTQPSSTTDTAIEDLRSAIANIASKLDRLNQNFSEQPVSNKEDLPKVNSNNDHVLEKLIYQLDIKISSLDSAISRVDSKIDRVENKLVETINAMKAELNGDIARTQNSLERNIDIKKDSLIQIIDITHNSLVRNIDINKDSLEYDLNSIKNEVSSLNKKMEQRFEKLEQMLSNFKSKTK